MKKPVIIAALITLTLYAAVESSQDQEFEENTVQVTRIIDGDTIEISTEKGREPVRFIGMDTPEVHSENNPEYFEGIPENEEAEDCMLDWARKSTEYVERKISPGEQIQLEHEGDKRDQYDRLRAHIHIQDKEETLNYKLVREGYANVFPVEFEDKERFEQAEEKARQERKGVWNCKQD